MRFLGRRPRPVPPAGPPAWLVAYFVGGVLPERGTPESREYLRARYFGTKPTIEELIEHHRAALEAEARRRRVTAWWPSLHCTGPRAS